MTGDEMTSPSRELCSDCECTDSFRLPEKSAPRCAISIPLRTTYARDMLEFVWRLLHLHVQIGRGSR